MSVPFEIGRSIVFDVREFEIDEEFLPGVVEASKKLGDSVREFLTLLSSYLSEIDFTGGRLILREDVESALIDVSAGDVGRMRILIFGNPDEAFILIAKLNLKGRTLWSGKIVRDEEDAEKAIDYFTGKFGAPREGPAHFTLSVARAAVRRILS